MRIRSHNRILLLALCAVLLLGLSATALAVPCGPYFNGTPIYRAYPVYPAYPAYPVYSAYPVVVQPAPAATNFFSATQYLNIRSGPSTKDPIIGYVNAGVVVKRIGEKGSYTQIQTNCGNYTAYVYTSYLAPYLGTDAASRVVYPPCQVTTPAYTTYQPTYWNNVYYPAPAPRPVLNPYPPCCR